MSDDKDNDQLSSFELCFLSIMPSIVITGLLILDMLIYTFTETHTLPIVIYVFIAASPFYLYFLIRYWQKQESNSDVPKVYAPEWRLELFIPMLLINAFLSVSGCASLAVFSYSMGI